jgi:apolipoprotein N-acyltransferase
MRHVQRAKGIGRAVAAVAAGALLSLAYPQWNLGWVVWLGLLPVLGVVWTGPGRRAGWRGFGLGWLTGAAFFGLNLGWLWTVSGLGALMVGGYLALFWGAWGAWAATCGNPWRDTGVHAGGEELPAGHWRGLRVAFSNAALWAGIEWLRGWFLTGFGWNGLGVALHDTPVLAQAADLLGVAGLSFLPVFVQCGLAQALRRVAVAGCRGWSMGVRDLAVPAALVAATAGYGVFRLGSEDRGPAVRVDALMIQRNIPQDVKWDPLSADVIYQGYLRATDAALDRLEEQNRRLMREAGGPGGPLNWPDLVVWPESALPEPLWFHATAGYPREQINADFIERAVLAGRGFTFIVGVNEMELAGTAAGGYVRKDDGGLYNSIAVFPGGFAGATSYRKVHLVPFGEFIPLRRQLPVLERAFRFSAGVDFGGDFDRGGSLEPLQVKVDGRAVGVVPAVCFEDTVGRLMRRFARPGPQLLLNATNDGWFKQSAAAEQHLANARFRCIELRRPMLRAANTGVTCLIDSRGLLADPAAPAGPPRALLGPDGRPFVEGELFGTLSVPEQATPTLYALAGDLPVVLLGWAGLLAGWWRGRNCGGRAAGPTA